MSLYSLLSPLETPLNLIENDLFKKTSLTRGFFTFHNQNITLLLELKCNIFHHMQCPTCQNTDSRVLESRSADSGKSVRRRRECIACGERHSTRETVDLNLPRLIKSDDSRQTFSEDKLRSGLLKALGKRPVEISKIETAIQKIQRRLMAQNDREVPSSTLGEWVMEELRALDEVAYIRFASVYRQFQDIEAFKSEIDKLMNK